MARWNIVLVSMFKDEAQYFDEWVSHYIALGVEHLFLYNNNSSDNSSQVLRKYINRGLVTLIDWPMPGGQVEAFNHATQLLRSSAEWITFLDTDEFLVLKNKNTIQEFLATFDSSVEQVFIPWKNFYYSGHQLAPSGLTIENFFWASNSSIVQVKHFVRAASITQAGVHFSRTRNRSAALEDGVQSPYLVTASNPKYLNAQINHYATRSLAENKMKIAKGEANGQPNKSLIPFREIVLGNIAEYHLDMSAMRHADSVRQVLNLFSTLTDPPHRYGFYTQNLSFAHNVNQSAGVHLYLAKSVANHLLGVSSPTPRVDYRFIEPNSPSGERDITSDLLEWSSDLIGYRVPDLDKAAPFIGSVHLSDFLRRYSAKIIQWWRGESISHVSVSAVVPRYHALCCMILVQDGAECSIKIAGLTNARQRDLWSGGSAIGYYQYGFSEEDKQVSVDIVGAFPLGEVLFLALP